MNNINGHAWLDLIGCDVFSIRQSENAYKNDGGIDGTHSSFHANPLPPQKRLYSYLPLRISPNKILTAMTDWEEVYCRPCVEQGDDASDILTVTDIHPLKLAFNKIYGLFICMHCKTPLDCHSSVYSR